MNKVAVIGLGQMGATLASLLLQAQMEVHVWNRSSSKAQFLVGAGAVIAQDAAQACDAADIVLMCVLDYIAADAILSAPGVKAALDGKLLLQLSTGSPQEARDMKDWAREIGAGFLDGAIQVAPEQMGQPDTTILISGDQHHYERARGVLNVLGGNIVYLGNDVGAAAVMDLATLSYIYGASAGFFQGAALAQVEGVDIGAYGAIVEAMSPSFGAFLRHEGNMIHKGNFTVSQSPLSISVHATRRIEKIMRDKGLRSDLPAVIAQLLQQTQEAGYGDEEFAAVVKVLKGDLMTPS